jgi:hypothetical protein
MSRPIRPGGFEAEGEGVGIDELQSARRQQRLLLGEGIYLGLIKDATLLQQPQAKAYPPRRPRGPNTRTGPDKQPHIA